jgi:hypothetical protein
MVRILRLMALGLFVLSGTSAAEPTTRSCELTRGVSLVPLTGPSACLSSDKSDYHPGERVLLVSEGWLAGETVLIAITVDPWTHDEVILTAAADAEGRLATSAYVVQESDLGVTFSVTATGLTSGLTAGIYTFSDDGVVTVNIVGSGKVTSNVSVKSGIAIDCPTTCATDFNNNTTVNLTAAPADSNATVSWSLSSGHTCGNGLACSFQMALFGGGNNVSVTVTFTNPPPTTDALSPSSKHQGDPAFDLDVQGDGFVHASVVRFQGADLVTTWLSTGELTAAVPDTDLAVAGTFDVTVTNPTPGGGTSSPVLPFTVLPMPPDAAVAPGPDAAAPGEDATFGPDAAAPGEDATPFGPDAAPADQDATSGPDAEPPGLDATVGEDAAADSAVVAPDSAVAPDVGLDASLEDATTIADASTDAAAAPDASEADAGPTDAAPPPPDAQIPGTDATQPGVSPYDLGGCGCGHTGSLAALLFACAASVPLRRRRRQGNAEKA